MLCNKKKKKVCFTCGKSDSSGTALVPRNPTEPCLVRGTPKASHNQKYHWHCLMPWTQMNNKDVLHQHSSDWRSSWRCQQQRVSSSTLCKTVSLLLNFVSKSNYQSGTEQPDWTQHFEGQWCWEYDAQALISKAMLTFSPMTPDRTLLSSCICPPTPSSSPRWTHRVRM